MVLSAIFLAALAKLLIETENPKLCAAVYGGIVLVTSMFTWLIGRLTLTAAILTFALGTIWAFIYFSVLNQFDFGTTPWWAFLIVGMFVPTVATAAFRWLLTVTWLAHLGGGLFTQITPANIVALCVQRMCSKGITRA